MAQWFGRLPLPQWPCCQSSWASAFKKLLEAFKLTVTSNRAFVLFLGQLSVVGSTIKLAIRKIWLTMAISWQNHVAKDLIVIWQTVHRRKLKLVRLSFIFCPDGWVHNSRQTVRSRTQNEVITSVLSTSKFNCNSSGSRCLPFVSCKVTWELNQQYWNLMTFFFLSTWKLY